MNNIQIRLKLYKYWALMREIVKFIKCVTFVWTSWVFLLLVSFKQNWYTTLYTVHCLPSSPATRRNRKERKKDQTFRMWPTKCWRTNGLFAAGQQYAFVNIRTKCNEIAINYCNCTELYWNPFFNRPHLLMVTFFEPISFKCQCSSDSSGVMVFTIHGNFIHTQQKQQK